LLGRPEKEAPSGGNHRHRPKAIYILIAVGTTVSRAGCRRFVGGGGQYRKPYCWVVTCALGLGDAIREPIGRLTREGFSKVWVIDTFPFPFHEGHASE